MTVKELVAKHKILQNVQCGVYIEDGWAPIIDNLCKEIESYCKLTKTKCVVAQVKEKFGSLRFYVDESDDSIDAFIAAAEKLCDVTCEECGKPGKLRGKSWFYTACDNCHKARQSKHNV